MNIFQENNELKVCLKLDLFLIDASKTFFESIKLCGSNMLLLYCLADIQKNMLNQTCTLCLCLCVSLCVVLSSRLCDLYF